MASDKNKRQALIAHCNEAAREHGGKFPAVTIEQFFDGNDDRGSIMCNLDVESMKEIRAQVEAIRARRDVQSVLVRISETMEDDPPSWPFADQVIVVTTLGANELRSLFDESMAPDEVGVLEETVVGVPVPKAGASVLVAWWD